MDLERVRTVMYSPYEIEVLYQGSPVWIDGILNAESIRIHFLNSEEQIQVPANMLVEKGE